MKLNWFGGNISIRVAEVNKYTSTLTVSDGGLLETDGGCTMQRHQDLVSSKKP
jgi:hypothetical protein